MKKALVILAVLTFLLSGMDFRSVSRQQVNTNPPAEPVRLVFIHHSTGGNWLADPSQNELGGDLGHALMDNNYYVSATNYGWGPDSIGDATDIPNWLDWFNSERSPVYLEALYNEDGQNFGDFGSWPRLDAKPAGENRIIVFKSCFPNSELEGSPNDAPNADGWLSVGHAKYVYNEILKYFATRPDKLFVVVTAPPLSSSPYGKNARAFNNWLINDWLAENNYTLNNVAVFDFYNVLTGADNHHRIVNGKVEHTYKEGQNLEHYPSGDDHPSRAGNQKATEEFVPMLNAFYNKWAATAPDAAPAASAGDDTTQATQAPAEPAVTAAPLGGGSYSENFENGAVGWEAFHDEGGVTTLNCDVSSEGAFESGQSLKMDFDVAQDGWATCGINFDTAQDWSASQGLGMQINPTGTIYHVDVYTGSPDNRQTYYFPLDAPGEGSGWTTLQLGWDSFKRVEWEENAGQPLSNPDQIMGIAFGVPAEGKGTLWVDDIQLLGSAPAAVVETEAVVVTEAPAEAEPAATEAPKRKGLPFCGGAAALPIGAVVLTLWKKRRK